MHGEEKNVGIFKSILFHWREGLTLEDGNVLNRINILLESALLARGTF